MNSYYLRTPLSLPFVSVTVHSPSPIVSNDLPVHDYALVEIHFLCSVFRLLLRDPTFWPSFDRVHFVLPFDSSISCLFRVLVRSLYRKWHTYLLMTFSSWVKWSRRWRFRFGLGTHSMLVDVVEPQLLLILFLLLNGVSRQGMGALVIVVEFDDVDNLKPVFSRLFVFRTGLTDSILTQWLESQSLLVSSWIGQLAGHGALCTCHWVEQNQSEYMVRIDKTSNIITLPESSHKMANHLALVCATTPDAYHYTDYAFRLHHTTVRLRFKPNFRV